MRTYVLSVLLVTLLGSCVLTAASVNAAVIENSDIVMLPGSVVGSGNGTLDLILLGFTSGGGVNENAAGGFDGDDSNIEMPTGGPSAVSESYITSMGEIRDFYILNFPDGMGGSLEDEMTLFFDMSETGQVNHITLNTLTIVIDYDLFPALDVRNDPLNEDIDSPTQNTTGSGFTGGTVIASLNPAIVPKVLPLNVQGSGFADYAILTGVNPFDVAFSDSTRVLFFWESTDHDDGGDKVFFSGSVRSTEVPEPTCAIMLMVGLSWIVKHPVGKPRRR